MSTVYRFKKNLTSNQNEKVTWNVTDVIVKERVMKIKADIFNGRKQLKSITLSQSLEEIEEDALVHCHSLESVANHSKKCYQYWKICFYGCKALYKVIFEEGSKCNSIFNGVFRFCESLKFIDIPKLVKASGLYVLPSIVVLSWHPSFLKNKAQNY